MVRRKNEENQRGYKVRAGSNTPVRVGLHVCSVIYMNTEFIINRVKFGFVVVVVFPEQDRVPTELASVSTPPTQRYFSFLYES